jgi:hypothetical protein
MKSPFNAQGIKYSAAVLALCLAATAQSSSHREAPFITQQPKVDATDFYMFRSYETGREGYVTLIANYNPLQDAYGGPNYFSMDPNALYEIHVDNNGDAVEDISFQFQFSNTLANDGKGISLNINGKDVAVPLKNIAPVTSADSSGLNFAESYSLNMVSGDRRTGSVSAVSNSSQGGGTNFSKPYDNIGAKTFSVQNYADYSNSFIHDVHLDACPQGAQSGRVFVGQRKDSFAVNLGEIFDLVNTNPLGALDGEKNIIADKNITTFALEVPIACLSNNGASNVIGAWTSASLPQVRVLDPTPTFKQPAVQGGAWTQVSRLSMPLVNEVVIGLPDKDKFNASEPKDDGQFLTYVTNPTLPALLEVLFGVRAPTAANRPDLVAAFLTGLTGVNANGAVGEMQRLNMDIAVTTKASQNNLGVAAGDNAGFPNGRRPGDDVVDATLRVAMGLLCHLNLGLCTAEDALDGQLAYTDGALQNAAQFNDSFPYLTAPVAGSSN